MTRTRTLANCLAGVSVWGPPAGRDQYPEIYRKAREGRRLNLRQDRAAALQDRDYAGWFNAECKLALMDDDMDRATARINAAKARYRELAGSKEVTA